MSGTAARAPRCRVSGGGPPGRRRRSPHDLARISLTSTRSQTSPTTVTSWLIRTSATSSAARIAASRSSTLLHGHVEGGGRLVGDVSAGDPISPIPIIARWRTPPENSCGYWCAAAQARESGPRACGRPRGARALTRSSPGGGRPLGELSAHPPGRVEGEVIGSWKTMASDVPEQPPLCLRLPRRAGRCRAGPAARRRRGPAPPRAARPPAPSGTCPSRTPPRSRSASPRRTEKETPRTGRIGPFGPGNATSRSRTSSTRSVPEPWACSAAGASASGASGEEGAGCPDDTHPEALATDSLNRLNASLATSTAMPGAKRGRRVDVDG